MSVTKEADHPMRHVLFTTTALVSLIYVVKNVAATETSVLSNDSVAGVSRGLSSQAARW